MPLQFWGSFRSPLLKIVKNLALVQNVGYCAVANTELKRVVMNIIHWAGNSLKTPGAIPSGPLALFDLIFLIWAVTSSGEIGSSNIGIVIFASRHSLTCQGRKWKQLGRRASGEGEMEEAF